ncbi:MAG: GmrSD restriction endonuclease domain-containing protein [Anaerolineaceae bacterium]
MSATMFKEVSYTLSKLIDDIEMGIIGLPEIQRPFVWGNAKVRDLFDSMYKGFPVGYFLFWSNAISNGYKQIGLNTKQKVPNLLVVDGQQRLTSLYSVINGKEIIREDYRKERIFIGFNPLTEEFKVTDITVRKNPEYISDISLIWSSETDIFELAEKYLSNLMSTREVSNEEQKAIKKAINNLDNIQNYPFTALEVSSSANEEQVAEIFVRVNSKGTPLNQADFILTLMSVFWDEGRAELEAFCKDARTPSIGKPSPFNYFLQPDPDQLLRISVAVGFKRARLNYAYLILRGKDLETEEFSEERRIQQFDILKSAQHQVLNLQDWHEFLKAIRRAGYVSNGMISSATALLYSYALFLIGKHDYGVDHYTLRSIIARWFFMVSITSRYSGSFESVMEQDLNRFRDISDANGFVGILDHIINDSLTDHYWNIGLPNELVTSSSRTPSLFAYYASLVLLKAPVLFSKLSVLDLLDPSTKAKKSALERHHLFPKGYLKKLGITEIRDTNQIANFALVEWSDNIDISEKSPADYFPSYLNRYEKHEWQKLRYFHALPVGWENLTYEDFLEKRRKGMAKVIRDGFKKLL